MDSTCLTCGAVLRLGAKLCVKCGTKVSIPAANPIQVTNFEQGTSTPVVVAPSNDVLVPEKQDTAPLIAGQASFEVAREYQTFTKPNNSKRTLVIAGGLALLSLVAFSVVATLYIRKNNQGDELHVVSRTEITPRSANEIKSVPPLKKMVDPDTPSKVSVPIESRQPSKPAVAATHVSRQQSAKSITEILNSAQDLRWSEVENQVEALKRRGETRERGDRKTARAENALGIAALRESRYSEAITNFQRGLTADASDIELANNLGYAYLQSGQLEPAIGEISDVLVRVPDRTSAWANLSEAYARADKPPMALAALRVAVRYSSNRQKTVDYLRQSSDMHSSLQFRTAASQVLNELANIPPNPLEKTAKVPSVSGEGVATRAPAQTPSPNDALTEDILTDGYKCLSAKRFDCAIANATTALKIAPNNSRALELKSLAQKGQQQALSAIKID